MSRHQVPLSDLAPIWLESLVLGTRRQAGFRSWLRACSTMKDILLSQQALRPRLSINLPDISSLSTPLYARALATAEEAAVQLVLHVKACSEYKDYSSLRTALLVTLSSAATMHSQRTGRLQRPPVTYQLQCIVAIKLAGDGGNLYIDCLVPDVLVLGCPNLKELELEGVTVAASPISPQPACTSLQTLHLTGLQFHSDNKWEDGVAEPSAQIAQQIRNLPSLTELSINDTGFVEHYEARGGLRAAIMACSSKLKQLTVCIMEGDMHRITKLPWSPSTRFPQLEYLDLYTHPITGDAMMQRLLDAAPNATCLRLQSVSGLTTSFAQVPCSWQELELRHVDVADLSKLPLSSCTDLECSGAMYLSSPDDVKPTPGQIRAGVAAAQAAGGLQFSYDSGRINLYTGDLQLLTAAAPLLAGITSRASVWLDHTAWPECVALLTVLGQNLACESAFMGWGPWSDHPGALAQLPQLLPNVEAFDLRSVRDDDDELVKMCRTATREFTIQVSNQDPRLTKKLMRAMRKAGHQLVTLEVTN